jgi:hypothetical protein
MDSRQLGFETYQAGMAGIAGSVAERWSLAERIYNLNNRRNIYMCT